LKKSLLISLVLMFISSAGMQGQAQQTKAKVSGGHTAIYESPDIESQLLSTLSKDQQVVLIMNDGEWSLIEISEQRGWIKTKDLNISGKSDEKKVVLKDISSERNTKKNTRFKTLEPGITAGVNLTGLYGDDTGIFSDRRLAYRFGGVLVYNLNHKFAILTGLIYSAEGAVYGHDPEDDIFKLDFIQIPILFKFTFTRFNERSSAFLTVGPKISYLVTAETVTENSTFDVPDIRKLNFGSSAGIGISYIGKVYKHSLELRAGVGLQSINDELNELDRKNYNGSLIYSLFF